MIRLLAVAGIGGTLPTLCRLAATYSVNPGTELPEVGLFIALALFFLIGMAVQYGFDEQSVRKAFALGIAGPAIVTSIFSGASEAKDARARTIAATPAAVQVARAIGFMIGIQSALAREVAASVKVVDLSSAELRIEPRPVGTASAITAPLAVTFLSDAGELLSTELVSSHVASTLRVPIGARAVRLQVQDVSKTVQLPVGAYESVDVKVDVVAGTTKDFLWALGGRREVRIEAVEASIGQVTVRPAPQPLPASSVVGTAVYTTAGDRVGVVQSVQAPQRDSPARILVEQ